MTAATHEAASPVQPVFAGVLAAVVGFASTFAVVLAGFRAVGASSEQAASGLFAVSLGMGLLTLALTLRTRLPIAVAWSTPGSALLVATGPVAGGFEAAAGAFLVTGLLVVAAGLVRPFGRAVAAIPKPIAAAMLAGVLLDLCLAPVRAVAEAPALALPIVIAWAVALRLARLWAVPVAVAVTAVTVLAATDVPPDALSHPLPVIVPVLPAFGLDALVGIALPLFVVTMASQNVPGLAVLTANGYRTDLSRIFVWTGLGSVGTSLLGGHTLNLAAITAALCAGPESHPDPSRRWIAGVANGLSYVAIAAATGFAAAFVAAAPPVLIQAVAGLALLGSLAGALSGALAAEEDRLPAIATFVTAASGVAFFGIGAAFWGLVAGLGLAAALRWRR